MRQTIAVDIDDVLSASAAGFAAYSNKQWGLRITAADYDENWAKVWGVSIEEAKVRAEHFHTAGVVDGYDYQKGAREALQRLGQTYNLIVVTSRRSVLKPETDQWLERHFPGLFKSVQYAGFWDGEHQTLHALEQHKAAICRELGADFLIDDQLKHCEGAAACGMQALLFGDYPWNRTAEGLPDGIIRVKDWKAAEEFFDGES